jgi:hypothetical protein
MPISIKLRRPCRRCKEMFYPDGKFCKYCFECRIHNQLQGKLEKRWKEIRRLQGL